MNVVVWTQLLRRRASESNNRTGRDPSAIWHCSNYPKVRLTDHGWTAAPSLRPINGWIRCAKYLSRINADRDQLSTLPADRIRCHFELLLVGGSQELIRCYYMTLIAMSLSKLRLLVASSLVSIACHMPPSASLWSRPLTTAGRPAGNTSIIHCVRTRTVHALDILELADRQLKKGKVPAAVDQISRCCCYYHCQDRRSQLLAQIYHL